MSVRYSLCKHCGAEFEVPGKRGRPPKYCRQACRQAAYERRRARDNTDAVSKFMVENDQRCWGCDNGITSYGMYVDLRTMRPYCGDCFRQIQIEEINKQFG